MYKPYFLNFFLKAMRLLSVIYLSKNTISIYQIPTILKKYNKKIYFTLWILKYFLFHKNIFNYGYCSLKWNFSFKRWNVSHKYQELLGEAYAKNIVLIWTNFLSSSLMRMYRISQCLVLWAFIFYLTFATL